MTQRAGAGPTHYHHVSDLPEVVSIFPLPGALLLPRGSLPLNIFEPRYLAMIDNALATSRMIGMVQPETGAEDDDIPSVYTTGCAGRITSFSETEDGRYLISLTGVCRFHIAQEVINDQPYRQAEVNFSPFVADLTPMTDEARLDREHLLNALRVYLQAQSLNADWESIENAPGETLVNSLCMICPFDPSEKQALLEAGSVEERAATLIALIEMASVDAPGGPGSSLN